MTQELRKSGTAFAPPSQASLDALENIKRHVENPFRCLDADWIPVVSSLAIAKGKLVGSIEGFCLLVRIQQTKGLTLAGLKAVARRLTEADIAATHNYDNQFLSDFHGFCAEAMRNQRRDDDRKRRLEAEVNPEGSTATILSIIDQIGRRKMPPQQTQSPKLPGGRS